MLCLSAALRTWVRREGIHASEKAIPFGRDLTIAISLVGYIGANSSTQERAKEELARAGRAHSGVVSALDVALSAEKSHCQDLRARLERQARHHEAALDEAEQRLLNTQQELDKVRAKGRGAQVEEVPLLSKGAIGGLACGSAMIS